MTITELAILKLYSPYSTLTHSLDETFLSATAAQAKWSSQPVYLFSDHDDPQFQRTIYLLSGWESVAAHQEWIKSDENQAWMKALGHCVRDVQLKHLDFAFDKEALDVGCVVYSDRQATEAEATGAQKDGAAWSAEGIDLEKPQSGIHRLASYAGALYSDIQASLGEPAQGETRIALKRVWASDGKGNN